MALSDFWKTRTHNLDRMTMDQLVRAYFSYPAIQAYLALAAISLALTVYWATILWPLGVAVLLAVVIYPLVWYLLHRFVLHGRLLYRSRWTAAA